MIRTLAVVLALSMAGAGAYAQSARQPDPLTLPQKGAGDEVIVPGTVQREVKAPEGDVRSTRQRARDRARFDRCVMKINDRDTDSPGANPVGMAPEEYCSQRLGMRDRNSAPNRKARSQ